MRCPICGGAELVHDTRDLPHSYKGKTTVLLAITAEFCPSCNESILDFKEADRVGKLMERFRDEVKSESISIALRVIPNAIKKQ